MENKLCKKCSNSTLKIFKNVPEWTKENCKQMERLPIFLEKKSQCHHLTYSWCYFIYLILWQLKTSSGFHLKSLVCTINYFITHFRREIALLRPMLDDHLTHYEPWNKRGSCVSSNISQCKAYGYCCFSFLLWEKVCVEIVSLRIGAMCTTEWHCWIELVWELFGHGRICGSKTKPNQTEQFFFSLSHWKFMTVCSYYFIILFWLMEKSWYQRWHFFTAVIKYVSLT